MVLKTEQGLIGVMGNGYLGTVTGDWFR